MQKLDGKTFTDISIIIDGNSYTNCRFERCEIIFCGAAAVGMKGCTFVDCKWAFDGPSLRTVQFMAALYAIGGDGKQLIEATFNDIRQGKPISTVKPS